MRSKIYPFEHQGSVRSRGVDVEASMATLSLRDEPAKSGRAFNLPTKAEFDVSEHECACRLAWLGWGKVGHLGNFRTVTATELKEDGRHLQTVGAVAAVACLFFDVDNRGAPVVPCRA